MLCVCVVLYGLVFCGVFSVWCVVVCAVRVALCALCFVFVVVCVVCGACYVLCVCVLCFVLWGRLWCASCLV